MTDDRTTTTDDETLAARAAPPYRLAIGRCNACPAPVYWLTHRTTEKLAPIDAQPDPERGNCRIDDVSGEYDVIGSPVRRVYLRDQGVALHTNHFLTCPAAKRFKSKPQKGPRA